MKKEKMVGGGRAAGGNGARAGINLNDKQSAPVFPVCWTNCLRLRPRKNDEVAGYADERKLVTEWQVASILIIITSNVITEYVPYPNLTNSGFINDSHARTRQLSLLLRASPEHLNASQKKLINNYNWSGPIHLRVIFQNIINFILPNKRERER